MEYTPHTLSNGKVVLYRRVSPFLGRALAKQFPEPKPPVQRVNYGTEQVPDWQEEPNPSHPDYLAAMQSHSALIEEQMNRLYLRRGVKVEWTKGKDVELEELKADMAGLGLPLEGDDQFLYVLYVVCDSIDVYQELVSLIMGSSQPQEEAIQAEVNGFRPEMAGA